MDLESETEEQSNTVINQIIQALIRQMEEWITNQSKKK